MALLLGLAVAGLLLAWLLRVASAQLLQRDAEHTALAWAELASAAVEDLEPLLNGAPLSDAARRDLLRHRRVQEVFRFKLFDRTGQPVLVSDDLDRPTAAAPQRNSIGHGNTTVRDLVLHGHPVIELRQGTDASRPAVYSEAYVPILRQGRVIGVVEVYVDQTERARRIRSAFGLVAGAVFTLLGLLGAGLAGWWLQRLRLARQDEARERYLAHHDVLSGLLNRTSFNAALDEAAWRQGGGGPGFALLCVDLHRFKEVNDAQGHDAGDEVLRQVGERLRALVRQGDRVARLASDEFAILLSGGATPEVVSTLAQRVITALGEPFMLSGASVVSGCSIGAAIFGVDAATPDELLHKADLALTRAKDIGCGGFSFYDATLDKRLDDRRQLAGDLRAAIGTPQLCLHYQPLFSGNGHQLDGYEALLRWSHPVRGPVSPAEFIPLAEETGLIEALGHWVLRTACATAAGWPAGLSVAVNLSPAQFRRDDLVDEVAKALADAGLPAERLELEITESLLMGNTEPVMRMLGELADMGVRIAMDDFGTGYSSLAYLWRFPFHKVKIDRAFTQHLASDPKVQLIVRSIISLAHSLAIRVNGEGVETAAQLHMLHAQGCDEFQGFLLGQPAPADALTHLQPGGTEPAQRGERVQATTSAR
ncbi:putative bifunctional diguanylate cyclase/phosphodiesterase [Aquabacterium sp.]|uniref:putative bifunctional diguanylate cyclase/phosphodiesterase n=1 Tax=Aquabacterium sp. TaxID=1872578 RepID=UPI002C7576E1|nr:EAL domain-containing protein [Aquabacterium sp.]HSW07839.1 EAL domain-containing protein [Aquabacterium sp.]